MSFAIHDSGAKSFSVSGRLSDWPLASRFALLTIPVGFVLVLSSIWLGYSASSSALMDSLETLPMLEAKIQASAVNSILKDLRRSLVHIAQIAPDSPEALRKDLEILFQPHRDLLSDFSVKSASGRSFTLFRDGDGYMELDHGAVSGSAYSPFQQITARPPHPGSAVLYPIVYEEAHPRTGKDAPGRKAVIRLAFQSGTGASMYVLGIDVAGLCRSLTAFMDKDSPLRLPQQEDAAQLSFFFDLNGWILFEMRDGDNGAYFPDRARHGYTGDLGRPGYDAAFRPWATHTAFWRMVTDVQAGRSGVVRAPADQYATGPVGATGILCFVPVEFSPSETEEPQTLGGIAFFETTTLPLSAFLRLANYSLIMLVAAIILSALLTWRFNRKLARPFQKMAKDLLAMHDKDEPAPLDARPSSLEHQRLQTAVNSVISTAMILQNDVRRMSSEVRRSRAQQPVDIGLDPAAPAVEAEFGLVGSSSHMEDIRGQVHKAAKAGTDVLIWGETGTGKELVAAAIHKAGARSAGPYISINCGALDENLLLDNLFGHVKGAFTEAKTDRKGAFISANGGTLHLDEIANASPKVQQTLLRALSVRRIRPLGSDKEIAFNTRVVAATNVDLRESVRKGNFREDLYYRLAIISIETPPLRHRKEDIPELAAFCIREAAAALGRPNPRISRGALEIMTAYDWPGNVRELKNCLTRALAFVEGDLILPQHITLERDGAYGKSLYPSPERKASPAAHNGEAAVHALSDGADTLASRPLPSADYHWPSAPRDFFSPLRKKKITPESLLQGGPFPIYPLYGSYTQPVVSKTLLPPYTPPPPMLEKIAPPPPVPTGLNERQQRALVLVRQKGEITRAQYEAVSGQELSSRTAQNDLRELVERGILSRVGAGPGTRYVLRNEQ